MSDRLCFPELERVGRLGNQLWQIASTVGLARRHGMEPRFPARWSYRPFFSVPDEMFADEPGLHPTALADLDHLDPRTRVYLQDPSLWAHVADEVRAMFAPSLLARALLGRLSFFDRPDIALHVRRGDNLVQQDYYPVASLDWWLCAVATVQGLDRLPVRLVSDDPTWCAEVLAPALVARGYEWSPVGNGMPRLKEHEAGYWDGKPIDWMDLFLLAENPNRRFVIANSSFGWWGAWLSGSQDVSYQWPFYGPRLDRDQGQGGYCDASLMFPPMWRRLPL